MTIDDMRIFLIAALLVGAMMFIMHGDHYRNRRLQILTFRVEALEKIIMGNHDV